MTVVREPDKAKILLVEDDAAQRLALSDRLTAEGYEVETARDGTEGARRASAALHDLIVLDVMLPGKDGFGIARELRSQKITTPILMLTARAASTDKVVGLQVGADDYLAKPFEFIELFARIEALLRRSAWAASTKEVTTFHAGDLSVDFPKAELLVHGQPVQLSAKEWQLLRHFAANPDVVLSRNELLDVVWGYNATTTTRTVDVHVARLRQKIEAEREKPRHILTVRGIGYKFSASS
jgi:two-component system alkaline phosphatase synthesis response regulator PhoP